MYEREIKCGECVYYDNITTYCWYPKLAKMMNDIKTEPCYEYIFNQLVQNVEPCEEMSALVQAPDCLKKMIYNDNETIFNVTDSFLRHAGKKTPKMTVEIIRNLRDMTEEFLGIFVEAFGLDPPL